MRYLDEYRERGPALALAEAIKKVTTRPWTLMEVCGGQTHSIVRYGLDALLPKEIELVHGPGCPVCVTPLETIDRAHAIAARREVILCSFGDMLRVPGSHGDLMTAKANGADVRILYSPLDALAIAERHPEREVVFLAVGFETTAPANAMAVWLAKRRSLRNFSILVSHVLVPPAITSILQAPDNRVNAFLGPGHVCTVMGTSEYEPIARTYRVPIVITGFEPVDLLSGVLRAVTRLEAGEFCVDNAYARAVKPAGNEASKRLIEKVFEVCDRKWRGLGTISKSGYRLSFEFEELDAERRFDLPHDEIEESSECQSGLVLRGRLRPNECPAFGTRCTPDSPLGATMVSAEGACAAYFAAGRLIRGQEGIL
ncbi:MAG: hydrogenase formation protein HypD [Deltaproteobacteria bacterium]|nr:hydrogenase formation protein HypD [Deltaproteobacteria bacterium]